MDGAKYRTILEENLLESVKDLRLRQRFIFQQDNDPKHKAKSTIGLFTNKQSFSDTGDLRIVLLGKTGVGKSATGNTILQKEVFKELLCANAVTSVCQKESAVRQRRVTVIDTPGLFDTSISNKEIIKEIVKCITMAAPGPHVFLLVLTVGRFTQEEKEAVKMIQDLFGEESRRYTMVLFTRGDDLSKMSIEDYIKDSEHLQNIIYQCGNRYHVFNNKILKTKPRSLIYWRRSTPWWQCFRRWRNAKLKSKHYRGKMEMQSEKKKIAFPH
uniref:AIG1-type G domain-containing protein n=1 Tax=Astyanax mexicanus TaxID=7994 RepID=A0A3B1K3T6_ASTMX